MVLGFNPGCACAAWEALDLVEAQAAGWQRAEPQRLAAEKAAREDGAAGGGKALKGAAAHAPGTPSP